MGTGGGRRVLEVLGVLASLYLGGMLLYAAAIKAADPPLFVEQVRGYGILPNLARLGAYAFLWIECILGLMLILRVLPRWSLLGFVGLMLVFIGATAYAWSQGNAESCGCFGRISSRGPREVIIEDLFFVALAGFSFMTAPWLGRSRGRWMAYGLVLPAFLALPWVAPRLPVDSLVTGVKPGYDLETMAADDLKVPLGDGTIFLALLGPDCEACVEALPMMAELGRREGGPRVTGVFSGDRGQKRAWTLENVPPFALAHASPKAMRQYYRKLPAFLLLQEGKVRRVWWGTAPAAEAVMAAMPGAGK